LYATEFASRRRIRRASAGSHDLIGKTNAQVAAFFKELSEPGSPMLDPRVVATALDVYATTTSLGGSAAQSYGFTVTATGLGARSYNVGDNGAAFGVSDGTTLNVYQILKGADSQAVRGILYVTVQPAGSSEGALRPLRWATSTL